MNNVLNRETNSISISTFWENYLLEKYNFEPAYQRRSVWSEEKQSFFIDSLLKNLPIPPIFLHQKIDDDTGKTSYDVIDGKQRLESIINFIENKITASDESEDSPLYNEDIAGTFFRDLDNNDKLQYKKMFWRYQIPIEYVDTTDEKVIDNIFDRLNRNGEPLNGQELRKSNYHSSSLLHLVEECSEFTFWKQRLSVVDVARMEHYEFVSELIFVLLEEEVFQANQAQLDELYAKYADISPVDSTRIQHKFETTTNYLKSLNLDYEGFRITGVSHLYGLWAFSISALALNIPPGVASSKLVNFYSELRDSTQAASPLVEEYRKSMSARTKDKGQRRKRRDSLVNYVTS